MISSLNSFWSFCQSKVFKSTSRDTQGEAKLPPSGVSMTPFGNKLALGQLAHCSH